MNIRKRYLKFHMLHLLEKWGTNEGAKKRGSAPLLPVEPPHTKHHICSMKADSLSEVDIDCNIYESSFIECTGKAAHQMQDFRIFFPLVAQRSSVTSTNSCMDMHSRTIRTNINLPGASNELFITLSNTSFYKKPLCKQYCTRHHNI